MESDPEMPWLIQIRFGRLKLYLEQKSALAELADLVMHHTYLHIHTYRMNGVVRKEEKSPVLIFPHGSTTSLSPYSEFKQLQCN